MRRPAGHPVALLAVALAAACIERAPNAGGQRQTVDRAAAARWLVTAPRPAIAVGAQIGGVELVGLDVDPPQLRRGARATLTFYWRVVEEPDTRWTVFVHLDAPPAPRLHGDHDPAGGAYPTSAWRRGEVIRDPVTIAIPAGHPARTLAVWVGLFAGNERCPVTRPGALGQDGEDRVLAARLPLPER